MSKVLLARENATLETYQALIVAFDFFNAELFQGSLPECIITLRGRGKNQGFHHSRRFVSADGSVIDEIALNSGFFMIRPIEIALSTLVHEMVHHWQEHFGKASKFNPHNREWVLKMEEIGLVPSSTGFPGGRQTGRSIGDYVIPEGRFAHACAKLIGNGFNIIWFDRHISMSVENSLAHIEALERHGLASDFQVIPALLHDDKLIGSASLIEPTPTKASSRVKYECRACNTKAWANFGTEIVCGICMKPFVVATNNQRQPLY